MRKDGRLPDLEALLGELGAEDQIKPSGRYLEAADHEEIFVPHAFAEQIIDLGEIRMNYVAVGSPSHPALLLIPGQTESWWGYEDAIHLLSGSYQVYAVDLRGQGRSTWTPGRYSIDNFGNDLVRFIDKAIGRPVVVCGLSSGGVVTAWLSAFAAPGQVLAAVYEDPPLFASEVNPAVGQSIRQTIAGPLFRNFHKYLGSQWSIGNQEGMMKALINEAPLWLPKAMADAMADGQFMPLGTVPNLREYDPEWADAFWTGRAAMTCDHESMLRQVKVPVLFTHHYHRVDPTSGNLLGAISEQQVKHVQRMVESTGNSFTYRSFPDKAHAMHGQDPVTYVTAITEWIHGLGLGPALQPNQEQIPPKEKAAPDLAEDKPSEEKPTIADVEVPPTEPATPGSLQVDGLWKLSVKSPMGDEQVTLTLKASGDSFGGTLSGDRGTHTVENGRIKGSAITFQAQSPFKVKVNYVATIDGEIMTGKAKASIFPAISFTGKRAS